MNLCTRFPQREVNGSGSKKVWVSQSGRRAFLLMRQTLDPRLHYRRRPIFEQPLRHRLARAADRERLVLVAAAVGAQLPRLRDLVIDLENIAVRVGEIKAALVDVVRGAHDRDAALDQMRKGLPQRRVAADLEGDVGEPDFSALRA